MPDFTALRSMVNLFLTDSCTINQPASEPVFSSSSGTYENDEPGAEIYDGPCRVVPFRREGVVEVGEEFVTQARLTVYLPASAVGVKIDDLITIADSSDADLAGRVLRVAGVEGESDAVYRKLECQDTLVDAEAGS
jgi:hypothetical protein